MAKILRVHELAKELGMSNQETLDLCAKLGIGVKTQSSTIIEQQADRVRVRAKREGLVREEQPAEAKVAKKVASKKVADSAAPVKKAAAKKAPAKKSVAAKKGAPTKTANSAVVADALQKPIVEKHVDAPIVSSVQPIRSAAPSAVRLAPQTPLAPLAAASCTPQGGLLP